MGILMAAFYDWTMRRVEERCLTDWRRELLADLRGSVLELGSGTGINLPFYPEGLDRLVLAEPDRHMRVRLQRRARELGRRDVEVSDAAGESLPFPDATFDAVVSTLVLCSVPDPEATLREIRRLLRPDGRLLFVEHVAAEGDERLMRWQRRFEPLWRFCAGNCHLTRRTGDTLAAAGFRIDQLSREEMQPAPAVVRPTIRGAARLAP